MTYVAPSIEPTTRAAAVRVETHNPGGRLKLGMFVNLRLDDIVSGTAVVIPRTSLQTIGERGRQVVVGLSFALRAERERTAPVASAPAAGTAPPVPGIDRQFEDYEAIRTAVAADRVEGIAAGADAFATELNGASDGPSADLARAVARASEIDQDCSRAVRRTLRSIATTIHGSEASRRERIIRPDGQTAVDATGREEGQSVLRRGDGGVRKGAGIEVMRRRLTLPATSRSRRDVTSGHGQPMCPMCNVAQTPTCGFAIVAHLCAKVQVLWFQNAVPPSLC